LVVGDQTQIFQNWGKTSKKYGGNRTEVKSKRVNLDWRAIHESKLGGQRPTREKVTIEKGSRRGKKIG